MDGPLTSLADSDCFLRSKVFLMRMEGEFAIFDLVWGWFLAWWLIPLLKDFQDGYVKLKGIGDIA